MHFGTKLHTMHANHCNKSSILLYNKIVMLLLPG